MNNKLRKRKARPLYCNPFDRRRKHNSQEKAPVRGQLLRGRLVSLNHVTQSSQRKDQTRPLQAVLGGRGHAQIRHGTALKHRWHASERLWQGCGPVEVDVAIRCAMAHSILRSHASSAPRLRAQRVLNKCSHASSMHTRCDLLTALSRKLTELLLSRKLTELLLSRKSPELLL